MELTIETQCADRWAHQAARQRRAKVRHTLENKNNNVRERKERERERKSERMNE